MSHGARTFKEDKALFGGTRVENLVVAGLSGRPATFSSRLATSPSLKCKKLVGKLPKVVGHVAICVFGPVLLSRRKFLAFPCIRSVKKAFISLCFGCVSSPKSSEIHFVYRVVVKSCLSCCCFAYRVVVLLVELLRLPRLV